MSGGYESIIPLEIRLFICRLKRVSPMYQRFIKVKRKKVETHP